MFFTQLVKGILIKCPIVLRKTNISVKTYVFANALT